MKLYTFLLLAAAMVAPTASARNITPSNKLVTKTVSVSSFDELDAGWAHVIVNIGPATGNAKITAPDNLIDELILDNSGSELTIKYPRNINIKGDFRTTVELTVPSLKEIDARLSSKVEVRGNLETAGDLDLTARTSATILLGKASAGEECELDATTSSKISVQELKAGAKTDIKTTTSASVKIGKLTCGVVEATATTSSHSLVKDGTAQYGEFKATTSGSIDAAGLRINSGKADPTTSGSIKSKIQDLVSMTKSTGGSISNNN